MADKVVMVSADQAGREELAKAMKELAANPPSETVAGGRYRNAAGETVDANGQPIKGAKASAEGEPDAPQGAKSGAKK